MPPEELDLDRQHWPHRHPAPSPPWVEPDRLQHRTQPTPDAELHLPGGQQPVADDLGDDGDGLDLAGRDIAEAGYDELADLAALRLEPFPAQSAAPRVARRAGAQREEGR
jgi:hypothetical protein